MYWRELGLRRQHPLLPSQADSANLDTDYLVDLLEKLASARDPPELAVEIDGSERCKLSVQSGQRIDLGWGSVVRVSKEGVPALDLRLADLGAACPARITINVQGKRYELALRAEQVEYRGTETSSVVLPGWFLTDPFPQELAGALGLNPD